MSSQAIVFSLKIRHDLSIVGGNLQIETTAGAIELHFQKMDVRDIDN